MLQKVVIVGRPNVGKSSLMNMLAGRRISIVDPTAGVTRDRVGTEIEIPPVYRGDKPRVCELVDTGGYGVYDGDPAWGSLRADVERQITFAVDEAALILFVVDGQSGLSPLDQEVARLLRQRVKDTSKVLVVANKVDDRTHEADASHVARLGFGPPVMTSATTHRGRTDLFAAMAERLGDEPQAEQRASTMLLAIVGRRNAGKSTLVNTLAGSERVIVSEIPGTTRDSVDVRFEIDGGAFTAIDTAGVRKRKSLADDIEYYSLHRALKSIRRADVVVLLIDATDPVSTLEKQLGAEVAEHFKPCVIAVNKWDLVKNEHKTTAFVPYLKKALVGLDYAPIVFISAKDNEGVRGLVKTARDLHEQASRRIPTAQLNETMQLILQKRGPSPRLGQQARIYYVTMPSVSPPTITLFVNTPKLFDQAYQRYLQNRIKEHLPYSQVPIKMVIRGRSRVALPKHEAKPKAHKPSKPRGKKTNTRKS